MAAPETLTSAGTAPVTPGGRRSIIMLIAEMRAWLFLALLIVFFEVWARSAYGVSFIFNTYNLQSISVFATTPLLLALGQTFVIISAGIDLSLGFVMGLASVIAAHVANYAALQLGLPPFAAMLVGVLAGVAMTIIPGLVNGWLIAHLRVPPFIGTLGMYGVARGSAYLFAGGMTVSVSNSWYSFIGNGRMFGIPILVILAAIACLIMHYLLSQTRFGQHTYAMGASQPAARRAGINIKKLTMKIYLLSAIMAGVAGVLYTGPLLGRRRAGRRAAAARLDRGGRHRRRQPVRRLRHDLGHGRRRTRHRRDRLWAGLRQRRAVLAVHRRRHRHHHLRAGRPDPAPPHGRAPG